MVSSDFRPGSPNWIGLGSPDLAESGLFYGSLFGWELDPSGPNGYGLFRRAGRTVAGVGPLTETEALPAWTVYFGAADAAGVAAAAGRSGGTVRVGPTEVPGQGRFAQLTDPAGGRFAVWQAGGTAGLEAVGGPGALCWAELRTSDAPGALRFYRGLFDWRSRDSQLPGTEYTVLRPADGGEEFGGVAGVHPRVDVGWLVHFAVADALLATDEVRRLGGSVVVPPERVPSVGRIAVLADPFGAQFALLEPEPRR
ncbi:VOC family protein [Kitasatospora sp. NA04385]|uniref:VOC family protein n=1 Tax=Kitasatospora sp. NA04385 TaxID=2742135 RepID=UPI0015904EFF|nr:VOC family protein [Kitasatospora sp. NA04385]QKW19154.1 VOC family protein [Kitasatospora sp. NA04385]